MSAHQGFRTLSPQDFEELVGDLFDATENVRLERFSGGRDGGIDLRVTQPSGPVIVVQCKHRPGVTFATLLRDLEKQEKPKVEKLQPDRYVIVTSAGLTPRNKQTLLEKFDPWIRSTSDIWGPDQLEALLRQYPKVEQSHFKLWLTSTAVLERVLNNAEVTRTDFEVERIRKKLPLFVETKARKAIEKILEETQVAIVSGPPGIGKTTLADLLLYLHLAQGYEPVVMMNGVDDGRRLFDRNKKQIFYFDDFLGQTFVGDQLDAITRNRDRDLLAFMEQIRLTKDSRFLLTTREHILRKAIGISERLAQSELVSQRFVLRLDEYDFFERARILYNHFWFGDLSTPYRDALLKDDLFLEIIRHDNFNPRLIEWLTKATLLSGVGPARYPAHVRELLEHPERLWAHAYDKQISEAAKSILLTMGPLGDGVQIQDLRRSWNKLHRARAEEFGFVRAATEFKEALKQLEGSFLTIAPPIVFFANPSVRDFAQSRIIADGEGERIVEAAASFRQITNLRSLAENEGDRALLERTSLNDRVCVNAIKATLLDPDIGYVRTHGVDSPTRPRDGIERRLSWILAQADTNRSIALELAATIVDYVKAQAERLDIAQLVAMIQEFENDSLAESDHAIALKTRLVETLAAKFDEAWSYDWQLILELNTESPGWTTFQREALQQQLGAYSGRFWCDEVSQAEREEELLELRETFEILQRDHGLALSNAISAIDERLAELEPPDDYEGYRSRDFDRTQGGRPVQSDAAVRRLFSTLTG